MRRCLLPSPLYSGERGGGGGGRRVQRVTPPPPRPPPPRPGTRVNTDTPAQKVRPPAPTRRRGGHRGAPGTADPKGVQRAVVPGGAAARPAVGAGGAATASTDACDCPADACDARSLFSA